MHPGIMFNSNGCIYCAARLVQAIKKLPIGRDEKISRCQKALAMSVSYGLNEASIRALEKGDMAVEPPPRKGK
jgi:hypothetical protein